MLRLKIINGRVGLNARPKCDRRLRFNPLAHVISKLWSVLSRFDIVSYLVIADGWWYERGLKCEQPTSSLMPPVFIPFCEATDHRLDSNGLSCIKAGRQPLLIQYERTPRHWFSEPAELITFFRSEETATTKNVYKPSISLLLFLELIKKPMRSWLSVCFFMHRPGPTQKRSPYGWRGLKTPSPTHVADSWGQFSHHLMLYNKFAAFRVGWTKKWLAHF